MFTKQRIPFSSASLFHGWVVRRSIYYLTPSCQTHSVSTQCPVWTLPQVCFLFRASWKSQHHGWLSFSTVFPPFRKQGWEHCTARNAQKSEMKMAQVENVTLVRMCDVTDFPALWLSYLPSAKYKYKTIKSIEKGITYVRWDDWAHWWHWIISIGGGHIGIGGDIGGDR